MIHRPRPFDKFGADESARQAWGSDEYAGLMKPDEKTGLGFAEKTALMVAYERQLESERPATERLFDDWLAKAMCDEDENGNLGKRVSDCMASGLKMIFDPAGEIGLGFEGHVQYTAARTCLINDHLSKWLDKQKDSKLTKQILDLGAGLDTRPFWLQSLASADVFIEVDTKPICDWKAKILTQVEARKGASLSPICKRQVVPMNFEKESVKDLPNHGVGGPGEAISCWLLEGLIMYPGRFLVSKCFPDALQKGSRLRAREFGEQSARKRPATDSCANPRFGVIVVSDLGMLNSLNRHRIRDGVAIPHSWRCVCLDLPRCSSWLKTVSSHRKWGWFGVAILAPAVICGPSHFRCVSNVNSQGWGPRRDPRNCFHIWTLPFSTRETRSGDEAWTCSVFAFGSYQVKFGGLRQQPRYLQKEEVQKLLREITELSSPGSYLILNFMNGSPAAGPDGIHTVVEEGWEREAICYFGDAAFSYGRYPPGKPANQTFGFSFYTKR